MPGGLFVEHGAHANIRSNAATGTKSSADLERGDLPPRGGSVGCRAPEPRRRPASGQPHRAALDFGLFSVIGVRILPIHNAFALS